MKPGRELDAQIAEKVMGLKSPVIARLQDRYSTDIAVAWVVVDKLGLEVGPTFGETGMRDGCWFAEKPGKIVSYSKAGTAPHAICLAALRAVA